MRVFHAKIHDGMVVTDEKIDLPEGAAVTVVANEGEESFDLSPEEEEQLELAIAECNRGDVVSAEDLLRRLNQ